MRVCVCCPCTCNLSTVFNSICQSGCVYVVKCVCVCVWSVCICMYVWCAHAFVWCVCVCVYLFCVYIGMFVYLCVTVYNYVCVCVCWRIGEESLFHTYISMCLFGALYNVLLFLLCVCVACVLCVCVV